MTEDNDQDDGVFYQEDLGLYDDSNNPASHRKRAKLGTIKEAVGEGNESEGSDTAYFDGEDDDLNEEEEEEEEDDLNHRDSD